MKLPTTKKKRTGSDPSKILYTKDVVGSIVSYGGSVKRRLEVATTASEEGMNSVN